MTRVGPWDERLTASARDAELWERLHGARWRVRHAPGARRLPRRPAPAAAEDRVRAELERELVAHARSGAARPLAAALLRQPAALARGAARELGARARMAARHRPAAGAASRSPRGPAAYVRGLSRGAGYARGRGARSAERRGRAAPLPAFLARNPFPHPLTEGFFYREKMRAIHRVAPDVAARSVLEVGGGRSGLARLLYPAAHVTTIDMDPEHASAPVHRDPLARFLVADATDLPFGDASFDVVTMLDVLEHIPDDRAAASEAWRVLEPGGHLLASSPNERWRSPYHRVMAPICPERRGDDRPLGPRAARLHDRGLRRACSGARRTCGRTSSTPSRSSATTSPSRTCRRRHAAGPVHGDRAGDVARLRAPAARRAGHRVRRELAQARRVRPAIALLPWGDVIEDFLDTIGVSLEQLRDEYTGGWLFGYIDALASAGVDTVLVCVSRQVREPVRWRHAPTGAELVLLPQPRAHRLLRRPLAQPYAWNPLEAGRARSRARRGSLRRPRCWLAPYAATPLRALGRELRRRPVAAVLCQEYEYARFDVCVALGRLLGVPVFATDQGGAATRPGIEALVRPLAMRGAAGFVVAAAAEERRIARERGVPPARIARIPNPVTHAGGGEAAREARRRELGVSPATVVVAWHGRVELHRKGLDVLADAWEALAGAAGSARAAAAADRPGPGRRAAARAAGGRRRASRGSTATSSTARSSRSCSPPPTCTRSPRATRGSPSRRSRRWRAACPSSPPTRPGWPRSCRAATRTAGWWCRAATPPRSPARSPCSAIPAARGARAPRPAAAPPASRPRRSAHACAPPSPG